MDNKKIYIIDDEDTIQKLLSSRLSKTGYSVYNYTDPRKVIKDLEKTDKSNLYKTFDLMLIDIKMPHIDGLTLLNKIKKMGFIQPAILITGHGDKEAAIQAVKIGAYDFIEKPFDLDVIEQSVKRGISMFELKIKNLRLIEDLKEANQNLEEKIKQRTAELEKANKQLEQLSLTDPMTKLYNRRYLEKTLEAESERSKRYNKPLSVIMLDTDNFKNYNDVNGHLMGDKLLIKIADIFRKDIRSSDFASRYGGEEFTILLPETNLTGALDLAERIRKDVEKIKITGKELQPGGKISISAGVSSYPELVSEPGLLLENADNSLYKAKNEGKNRVIYSDM